VCFLRLAFFKNVALPSKVSVQAEPDNSCRTARWPFRVIIAVDFRAPLGTDRLSLVKPIDAGWEPSGRILTKPETVVGYAGEDVPHVSHGDFELLQKERAIEE
jgi:hypothetical protein